jgi:hypothetical protein
MENLANVSKNSSKISQIYSRKKVLCFLVEKPTKVVEKNRCLGLSSPVATSEN